ncbi:MAG: DUF262 domain-containing protein [Terrimicrobiaceae bacterium]|nr:DUF262 domain-containing protein [Terrimicrobiaceae bacterium]
MNWKWISSSHPISDIRDWSNQQRIEIRPDFQRKEVWSPAARVLLMDTILRNIPMPKIFLQAVIRNNDTYRVVIDGQQRIKAILAFLNDDIKLIKPYSGEYFGLKFSELPANVREDILSYKIDINEIRNAPDDIVRDIYSRVNKYTVALNKQELRRADFPGAFLRLSEELAQTPFFEVGRVFTVTNSKRMGDVEFVSELLALLLRGPQDKRETLDDFYMDFTEWPREEEEVVKTRFMNVLSDFERIFVGPRLEFAKTRFRQKADFYSLFAAIDDCLIQGGTLDNRPHDLLREDLTLVDQSTAPESEVRILSHYAIQCVSHGNSLSSRTWRRDFLKNFLHGTYFASPPPPSGVEQFRAILLDGYIQDMCPPAELECPVCSGELKNYESHEEAFLTWRRNAEVFQLHNAEFVHLKCREAAEAGFFVWHAQPDDNVAVNPE